ncbi:hypothetical protein D9757_014459 [Collybiopsis confluens]|uniref:Uncharacterized protein n=1 Tax=Collybiopsis confluens TaxID=2823264 RepID=A0A8H5CYG9_9AGAR|nr:hypothetical protein D9757_014459 [Collybiopsis confluens]
MNTMTRFNTARPSALSRLSRNATQSFVTIYNIIAREPILNYLKLWTTKLSSSSRSRSISRYRRYTATREKP